MLITAAANQTRFYAGFTDATLPLFFPRWRNATHRELQKLQLSIKPGSYCNAAADITEPTLEKI